MGLWASLEVCGDGRSNVGVLESNAAPKGICSGLVPQEVSYVAAVVIAGLRPGM